MKFFTILLAFFATSSYAANPASVDLTFSNAVQAHCAWEQGPQTGKESILQVLWSTENPSFKVDLFMSDMGHGSAPTQIQRIVDANGEPIPGAYRIKSMYFMMAGNWEVNITLKFPDGSQETQTIKVTL